MDQYGDHVKVEKITLDYFFKKQLKRIEVSNPLSDQDKEGPTELHQISNNNVCGKDLTFSSSQAKEGF